MVLCHINFALYGKQCVKISSWSVFLKQIQITSHVQDDDWFSVSTLGFCEKIINESAMTICQIRNCPAVIAVYIVFQKSPIKI